MSRFTGRMTSNTNTRQSKNSSNHQESSREDDRGPRAFILPPVTDGKSYLRCWNSISLTREGIPVDQSTLADWFIGNNGRGWHHFLAVSHVRDEFRYGCGGVDEHR